MISQSIYYLVKEHMYSFGMTFERYLGSIWMNFIIFFQLIGLISLSNSMPLLSQCRLLYMEVFILCSLLFHQPSLCLSLCQKSHRLIAIPFWNFLIFKNIKTSTMLFFRSVLAVCSWAFCSVELFSKSWWDFYWKKLLM